MIEIHDEFQTDAPPQIRQRNISADWFQFYVGVERKKLAIVDEAIERVAVEVIAVSWIRGPVGVGVMRSHNRDSAIRLSDAIEFSHKGHNVGNMLGDMTTDDLVEFIIGERIWNRSEIVNYIGMCFWICVDPNRPRCFVPATTDVKDPFGVFIKLGCPDCLA